MWKKCCFSGDGEFIAAGSARQHALYIWEKSVGNLVKILQGMKGDVMLDFVVSFQIQKIKNFCRSHFSFSGILLDQYCVQ